METMTGNFSPGFLAGVQTLSVRQSSPCFGNFMPRVGCGHAGPNSLASRMPSQRGGACGGLQRRSPAGAAAYGIPLNTRTSVPAPETRPDSVLTGSVARPPATEEVRQDSTRTTAFVMYEAKRMTQPPFQGLL